MEETKETKKDHSLWIIWLVGILVIFLGATVFYCIQLREEIKNSKPTAKNGIEVSNVVNNGETTENIAKVDNAKTYTYEELTGTYELTEKFKDDDGAQWTAYYELYLYSDGTYLYDFTEDRGSYQGIMGNYIISGNEIILNKLFSHGSDVCVTKEEGQIKLTINDDGSLTDKNNLLEISELSNINLKKESSSISKDIPSLSEYVETHISYLENELNK